MKRLALGALLLVVTAIGLTFSRAPAVDPGAARIHAVEGVGITVSDLDRAVRFYTGALSFEIVDVFTADGAAHGRLVGVPGARARTARLRLGEEVVELTEYLTPAGRAIPAGSRSNDRWFQHIAIVVNDMEQAWQWLVRSRVEAVSPRPQRLPDWNPKAGGIEAVYFKDPDGHVLEILAFPPDKGDPRWRRPSDRVFLGIDHTAIAVGSTDASLRFYRDVLGMVVVGESDNWGVEQERLNAVPRARLRITTLRASRGPGVELLEYVEPRDGRRLSWEPRSNDLVHWHTIVTSRDPAGMLRALGRNGLGAGSTDGTGGTSPELVTVGPPLGFTAGALVRDPDGHALQLRSGKDR